MGLHSSPPLEFARVGGVILFGSASGGREVESVVVFLDYQNVYHGARRAFFDGKGPSSWGNVWPLALGRLIACLLYTSDAADE